MSDLADPMDDEIPKGYSAPSGYALSGRIMLSAIIILFFVVVLMVFLHLYARWYLLRSRRRRFLRRNRHNRRTHLVFYVDPAPSASPGLDAAVLRSLPVFAYSSAGGGGRRDPPECAVCLSEFEDGEKARRLPRCGHCFHIECIDMWFESHSTCPLCRSPVEPVTESPERSLSAPATSVSIPDSTSGLCDDCRSDEPAATPRGAGPSTVPTSSFGARRKPQELVGVSIEVPRRTDFDDESASDSPASQYRSPMSRMLSFRRILSRDRRGGGVSPSAAASCAAAAEADLERGREETHHQ